MAVRTNTFYDPSFDLGQPAAVTYWATFIGQRSQMNMMIMKQRLDAQDPKVLAAIIAQKQATLMELVKQRGEMATRDLIARGKFASDLVRGVMQLEVAKEQGRAQSAIAQLETSAEYQIAVLEDRRVAASLLTLSGRSTEAIGSTEVQRKEQNRRNPGASTIGTDRWRIVGEAVMGYEKTATIGGTSLESAARRAFGLKNVIDAARRAGDEAAADSLEEEWFPESTAAATVASFGQDAEAIDDALADLQRMGYGGGDGDAWRLYRELGLDIGYGGTAAPGGSGSAPSTRSGTTTPSPVGASGATTGGVPSGEFPDGRASPGGVGSTGFLGDVFGAKPDLAAYDTQIITLQGDLGKLQRQLNAVLTGESSVDPFQGFSQNYMLENQFRTEHPGQSFIDQIAGADPNRVREALAYLKAGGGTPRLPATMYDRETGGLHGERLWEYADFGDEVIGGGYPASYDENISQAAPSPKIFQSIDLLLEAAATEGNSGAQRAKAYQQAIGLLEALPEADRNLYVPGLLEQLVSIDTLARSTVVSNPTEMLAVYSQGANKAREKLAGALAHDIAIEEVLARRIETIESAPDREKHWMAQELRNEIEDWPQGMKSELVDAYVTSYDRNIRAQDFDKFLQQIRLVKNKAIEIAKMPESYRPDPNVVLSQTEGMGTPRDHKAYAILSARRLLFNDLLNGDISSAEDVTGRITWAEQVPDGEQQGSVEELGRREYLRQLKVLQESGWDISPGSVMLPSQRATISGALRDVNERMSQIEGTIPADASLAAPEFRDTDQQTPGANAPWVPWRLAGSLEAPGSGDRAQSDVPTVPIEGRKHGEATRLTPLPIIDRDVGHVLGASGSSIEGDGVFSEPAEGGLAPDEPSTSRERLTPEDLNDLESLGVDPTPGDTPTPTPTPTSQFIDPVWYDDVRDKSTGSPAVDDKYKQLAVSALELGREDLFWQTMTSWDEAAGGSARLSPSDYARADSKTTGFDSIDNTYKQRAKVAFDMADRQLFERTMSAWDDAAAKASAERASLKADIAGAVEASRGRTDVERAHQSAVFDDKSSRDQLAVRFENWDLASTDKQNQLVRINDYYQRQLADSRGKGRRYNQLNAEKNAALDAAWKVTDTETIPDDMESLIPAPVETDR